MSQRRKYTKEFELEAVRMTQVPGVTIKQIAEELGINSHLLGKWRTQLREEGELGAFPGQGTPRDEEVAALKRELARVKKERDFLKEAAGCFIKPRVHSRKN
jgi:transposase